MSQEPVVPTGVPTPPPSPPRRTPVVTAAAGLLVTAGVLSLLAGLIVVLAGSDVLVGGEPVGDAARTVASIAVVVGAADIVVGLLVWRLVRIGRAVGFILAGLTVVMGLVSVAQGNTRSFLQVLLGGATIWALVAAEPVFRRPGRQ